MATIALTGSASGIGAATRTLLEADGHRVIGVDLRDAEIIGDLGTDDGRADAIAGVLDACDGVLDGYAGFAGVPATVEASLLTTVSYFGSVSILDGLKDALARGTAPSALAVSSLAATVAPVDDALVAALLEGDEGRALAVTGEDSGVAYASVKLALARWVRRHSTEWAADGIRLNALAPGNTVTPLTDVTLADPDLGPKMREIPVPVGHWAEPREIAAAAQWLLSPAASFVVGSIIFVDGGTDALVRPDDF